MQGYYTAISSDGTAIISASYGDNYYQGAIWIFRKQNGKWIQQGDKLVGTGAVGAAYQGISVAISSNGNTVVAGGPYDNKFQGAAWVFVRSTYTITASAGTGGKIEPNGAITVGYGATPEITITPDPGYQVFDVLVNGESQGAVTSYEFPPIEDDQTISAKFCPAPISISGKITTSDCKAVSNATVYLLNSDESYVCDVDPVKTNSKGQYEFSHIPYSPTGYKVLMFEPLGYAIDENPKVVPSSLNPHVDFTVTETVIGNQSMDRQYWKNQIFRLMTGRGRTMESLSQMNIYLKRITDHYQIHFPSIFPNFSTLQDWYNVLNLPKRPTELQRARCELATVLFNFVSLKVGQYFIASKDKRTAGDILTYASKLVRDKKDLCKAVYVAGSLNYRRTILPGIVPAGNILYKEGEQAIDWKFDVPEDYQLFANYPNPFNPSTTIRYAISRDNHVMLKIYNIVGEKVEELVDEVQRKGTYDVRWNAARMASGIYIYKIQAGEFIKSGKMILLK